MATPVAPNPNDNRPMGPAYAWRTGLPVHARVNPATQHLLTVARTLGRRSSSSNSNPKYQPSQLKAVAWESIVCNVWSDAVTERPRTTVAYKGSFRSLATCLAAAKRRAFNWALSAR